MHSSGTIDELQAVLRDADTVRDAAGALVELLQAEGFGLPSLYLEQGGRLRCQAQRGYWQVLDGIPTHAGVIGRTFRSGRTIVVEDAASDADFLRAAPDLAAEICAPILRDGAVVGVLSVESRTGFADGSRERVEQAADAFGRHLAATGGLAEETPAQRVARLAIRLAELDDEDEIVTTATDAAIQVSGMSTAAVVLSEAGGPVRVAAATGPLTGALEAVSDADLGVLNQWISAGSSLHTPGTGDSDLEVHGRLYAIGVEALLVVPLTAQSHRLGMLLVVSDEPRHFDARVISSMEILGTQVATNLRTARLVAELRERSRRDPLTGLGHHATFHEALADRLAHHTGPGSLAVMVIDIDGFKAVNDHLGHQEGDRILRTLSDRLTESLRAEDQLYRIGGDEFAAAMVVTGIGEATTIAQRLLATARQVSPATVSVGIAQARAGEAAEQLIQRADDAMYDAKRSGRDTYRIAGA